MSRQTVEQRVRRGIELLDARGPEGWRERVNLDRLDLWSPFRCVLGQVYAERSHTPYVRGLEALGIKSREKTFGFAPYDVLGDDDQLTYEWRRQLSACSECGAGTPRHKISCSEVRP